MAALFIEQTLRKNNKVNNGNSNNNSSNIRMNALQHNSNSIGTSQRKDATTTKETNKSMQIGFCDLAAAAAAAANIFTLFFVHFHLVAATQTAQRLPPSPPHLHTLHSPLSMSLCCYLLWHSALATIAGERRPLQGTAR